MKTSAQLVQKADQEFALLLLFHSKTPSTQKKPPLHTVTLPSAPQTYSQHKTQ